jgi:Fe2+ transport system protein FeoA
MFTGNNPSGSQIHIKTAQIGGKVFFSFPFFLGRIFAMWRQKLLEMGS